MTRKATAVAPEVFDFLKAIVLASAATAASGLPAMISACRRRRSRSADGSSKSFSSKESIATPASVLKHETRTMLIPRSASAAVMVESEPTTSWKMAYSVTRVVPSLALGSRVSELGGGGGGRRAAAATRHALDDHDHGGAAVVVLLLVGAAVVDHARGRARVVAADEHRGRDAASAFL